MTLSLAGFVLLLSLLGLGPGPDGLASAFWRGAGDPMALVVSLSLLLLLLVLPALSTEFRRLMRQGRAARAGSTLSGLLALLLAAVGTVSFAATLTAFRVASLSQIDLPAQSFTLSIVPVQTADRRALFDTRSLLAVESALADLDVALATAGPVSEGLDGQRAELRVGPETRKLVVSINRVSGNYFDLLGVRTDSHCEPFAEWGRGAVFANREFLRRYAPGRELAHLRLRVADGSELRVCGAVDDAQVADARGGMAPVLYGRLTERRDLGAVVMPQVREAVYRPRVAAALNESFPDSELGTPSGVDDVIARQLSQERRMAAFNALVMLLACLVAAFTSVALGEAAVGAGLRALATRRALGATPFALVRNALLGGRPWPWLVVSVMIAAGGYLIARSLSAPASAVILPALLAALSIAAVLACCVAFTLRSLRDGRLLEALRAEH